MLGYYSLNPASITYECTPEVVKRGLARHEVPVFRLGRLAVDCSDAKNQSIAQWYTSYGAIPLVDAHLSLLLSFKTIYAALTAVGKL